jgi:foldase protein PrsA
VIDDAAVERAVEKMRVSLQVVLIRTDTETEARDARERIEAGASAEDVAREVSTAPSRLRGGYQGLGWGQTEMPALEEAALATEVGTLSDVVPVEDSWAFVRVLQREELELTKPEMTETGARRVLRARTLAETRDRYLEKLRTKYEARIDTSLLDPEPLRAAIEAGPGGEADTRPVATFRGGSITLDELAHSIDAARLAALRPAQQRLQVEQLLSDRLDGELLELEGEARWDEVPEATAAELRGLEEELLFRSLLATVALRDVTVTADEMHAWYEENRETYVEPVRIKMAIALLDTEGDADRFLSEVADGARFSTLARERSLDEGTARHGGVAGWVTEAEAIPELRGEAFTLPAGTTGGPVALEAGWLVYNIVERVEARQLTEV